MKTIVLRRLRRRRHLSVEPMPDSLPKRGLFTEPVALTVLECSGAEPHANGWRVAFLVEVRDHDGRRCPDVAVEATLAGPARSATAVAHTDMFGRARFRTTGAPGRYSLSILDVAAGGLDWDRNATADVVAVDLTADGQVAPIANPDES